MPTSNALIFHGIASVLPLILMLGVAVLVVITCIKVIKYIDYKMKGK